MFVLFACARDGQEKHDDPRDTDFRPHFQVDGTNSGVQSGAHEDIVYEVTRHAHLFTTGDGPEVSPEGYGEAPDHGNSHDMTVVIDDFRESEYVVVVKDRGSDEGEVDREKCITVVHESLVSKGWHGQAFLHIPWHDPCKKEFVENETGIHLPRVKVRAGILYEEIWVRRLAFATYGPKGEKLTSRMWAHIS